MKISELVEKLQEVKDDKGEVDVRFGYWRPVTGYRYEPEFNYLYLIQLWNIEQTNEQRT